jgi:uncharacterized protein (DUF1778 family)
MVSRSNKTERFEFRVTPDDKQLIAEAQQIAGDDSVSEFILRVLRHTAQEIIADHNRVIASRKDAKVFFDAVFGDQKPNQALTKAAKKFRSKSA